MEFLHKEYVEKLTYKFYNESKLRKDRAIELEDVIQEFCICVIKVEECYDPKRGVEMETLIYKVCENRFIDMQRKPLFEGLMLDKDDDAEKARMREERIALKNNLYEKQDTSWCTEGLLKLCRKKLTKRENEVLDCLLMGMNSEETAEYLGITPGRVSQVVKNVNRKIQDVLEVEEKRISLQKTPTYNL